MNYEEAIKILTTMIEEKSNLDKKEILAIKKGIECIKNEQREVYEYDQEYE